MTRKTPALQAAFALSPGAKAEIFSPAAIRRISSRARLPANVITGTSWRRQTRALARAEVLFSGWGAPVMDEAFLSAAPRLRAVFYAADSVRYFTTPALWRRGVRLCAAHAANAVPVSEFVLAALLFGLKQVLPLAREVRTRRTFPARVSAPGTYGTRVGLVGYGVAARLLRRRLRDFDLRVSVFDPDLTPAEAAAEQVELRPLDAVFAECEVVSVHAGLHHDNHGLIGAGQLRLLRPMATFINTARGELVVEPELIEFLVARPDVQAVLDVCSPSPPLPSSPLFDLPNVLLTPHLSASHGEDCRRLGDAMVEEFERFLSGAPLRWEIPPAPAA